jgi:hypothetical protein
LDERQWCTLLSSWLASSAVFPQDSLYMQVQLFIHADCACFTFDYLLRDLYLAWFEINIEAITSHCGCLLLITWVIHSLIHFIPINHQLLRVSS